MAATLGQPSWIHKIWHKIRNQRPKKPRDTNRLYEEKYQVEVNNLGVKELISEVQLCVDSRY